jgi:transposase
MLKPKSPQSSFYGSYLYDRIIPQDHLLRKINQVVDFSFVNELVKDRYTPDFGRPAEDPEFMLRLCLLQYLYGDSDRKVVENAGVNLAYKFFLGLAVDEEVPDDTTISYFRATRLGEDKFRLVFENIVRQCIHKGLVTGKSQIIDSTHIVADMAVNSLTGLVLMCRQNVLKTVARQSPQTAQKLGMKDLQFTKQDRFRRMEEGLEQEIEAAKVLLDGVTNELKQGSLKVTPELQKDLALLEKAVADREEGATDRLISPVDPDARAGKKTHKSWTGYKGHLVVEEESEIIAAVETTPGNTEDGASLKPLLKQQEKAFSLKPEELSGDKAYGSGANLELLEAKGISGHISLSGKFNHIGKGLFTVDDFSYDEASDMLTCPGGHTARYRHSANYHKEMVKRNGFIFQFHPPLCNECGLKIKCHPGSKGRTVAISYYHPLYKQMKERMATAEGQAAYRNRYKIEHKIADLARHCGMRRCRYRGLARAGIHTLLAAIVSNVKRMAKLLWKVTDSFQEQVAMAV